ESLLLQLLENEGINGIAYAVSMEDLRDRNGSRWAEGPEVAVLVGHQGIGFRRGDVRGDGDLGRPRRDPANEGVRLGRFDRLDARFDKSIARRHLARANLLDEQALFRISRNNGRSRLASAQHG